GLALLQSGANDVGAVLDQSIVVVVDQQSDVASFDGERIHVVQALVNRVQNRQEARTLAALAMAYGQGRIQERGAHKPGTAEIAVSLPLYMLAQNQSREHGLAIPTGLAKRVADDPEQIRAQSRQAANHRADLAVHLAERAGSCTGPMVDLLNRMRGGDSTSAAASRDTQAGFARMVLHDLGKQAYPPDNHCVG
ncbi:MAG: hypothetical protein RL367_1987, partial [Pseudomonadota bacterium]